MRLSSPSPPLIVIGSSTPIDSSTSFPAPMFTMMIEDAVDRALRAPQLIRVRRVQRAASARCDAFLGVRDLDVGGGVADAQLVVLAVRRHRDGGGIRAVRRRRDRRGERPPWGDRTARRAPVRPLHSRCASTQGAKRVSPSSLPIPLPGPVDEPLPPSPTDPNRSCRRAAEHRDPSDRGTVQWPRAIAWIHWPNHFEGPTMHRGASVGAGYTSLPAGGNPSFVQYFGRP